MDPYNLQWIKFDLIGPRGMKMFQNAANGSNRIKILQTKSKLFKWFKILQDS